MKNGREMKPLKSDEEMKPLKSADDEKMALDVEVVDRGVLQSFRQNTRVHLINIPRKRAVHISTSSSGEVVQV